MILTTEQQAQNFALFAMEADQTLEGLDREALVGAVKATIMMVFGIHTFTAEQLDAIAEGAASTN